MAEEEKCTFEEWVLKKVQGHVEMDRKTYMVIV